MTRVLVEPDFKLAAERIADEVLALPPVDDAASLLQDLASTGAGSGPQPTPMMPGRVSGTAFPIRKTVV